MKGDALRAGDVVEAAIEKGVYRGRGLARHEGRVLFVPRAHPGDRVQARVSEVHAGWAEAALVEVLEASPSRKPSPCPYVPRCGGCAYQDYDDAAELRTVLFLGDHYIYELDIAGLTVTATSARSFAGPAVTVRIPPSACRVLPS